MYFVLFCNLLAVFFTYLDVRGVMKQGFKLAFILVTTIACLHYDFGSDYEEYYLNYKYIVTVPFNFSKFMSGDVYRCPGWALLNWPFQYIGGFFTLVATLNLIQNLICFKFIEKYTVGYNRVFSVFLYLCHSSYYMMNFSMMRQSFVMACFLCMWPLIHDKRWYYVLPIIYILSYIHNSAAILYPFAFWSYLPFWRNTKFYSIILISILFILLGFQSVLRDVFNTVMIYDDFQNYIERYRETKHILSFGLGTLVLIIPILFSFWYLYKNYGEDIEIKSIVALSMIGNIAVPFTTIIPLIGRVGLYFGIFTIVSFPIVILSLKDRVARILFSLGYAIFTIYGTIVYYHDEMWNMNTYHTIFEAL